MVEQYIVPEEKKPVAVHKEACDCCGKKRKEMKPFFIFRVCESCVRKLRRIAKGRYSASRVALSFYIGAQGCLIRKDKAPFEPPSESLRTLNYLAGWLRRVSRLELT